MNVIFLGTGTSHGVPMIACPCPVCASADPRDRRTRPSLALQYDTRCVLIDTSPDIRSQCIGNNICRIDAILYTHHHADHIVGLDDVRRFNAIAKAPIPCYASADCLRRIKKMFGYAFADDPDYPSAKPQLTAHPVHEPFDLFGKTTTPVPLLHGRHTILGFRFDNCAYCTDCNHIPDPSLQLLRNLDVLILDGLRRRPHPTHFNLDQAIQAAHRIAAKQTYFTHIAHELPHRRTNAHLPPNMALAYDGLTIEL